VGDEPAGRPSGRASPIPEHFLGVDLGTTGARAAVFDGAARLLGEATREYTLYTPRPGWAEQDAEEVWTTAASCIRSAVRRAGLRRPRVAVGISGTFHNVLPIGHDGRPRGRALIWADTRAGAEAAAIKAGRDAQALYERSGCPIHPMYLPAKLRWLRQHGGDAPRYGTLMEEFAHRLTGVWACSLSAASGTGLLDMRRRRWDEELLEIAGIGAERLGELVEPTEPLGQLSDDAARATGLDRASLVVPGAGDGVLSSLGAGTIGPGQMTATIGTSGAVRLVADAPKVDRQARTWCYYLAAGRWVAGAAINNGGIAFRWSAEKLLRAGSRAYQRTLDWAEQVGPGANGLLFLPFLTGERAPYWNADARGVLAGLAIEHDHRHVARATLEGICYRMRSIALALDEVAGPIAETRATGGYTRSPFWLQMLADVLERPLVVPSVQEASALGAAELAMLGTGALPDLAATRAFVTTTAPIHPRPDPAATYRRAYDLWISLYWALAPHFTTLATLQRDLATPVL
jgi:gluconokinase